MSTLPAPKGMYQGLTNACTVFSACYALKVMNQMIGVDLKIDPIKVHRAVLKKRYDRYDRRKSVSYKEVFQYLKEKDYIWRARKIQTAEEDWKIKLFQGFPVCATINDKILHAICMFGYDEGTFYYHDSMSKKYPFKELHSLEGIVESYILFL